MIETARKNARTLTEEMFALQNQLVQRQLEQSQLMEKVVIEALENNRKQIEQTLAATNELNRKMLDLVFPTEKAEA